MISNLKHPLENLTALRRLYKSSECSINISDVCVLKLEPPHATHPFVLQFPIYEHPQSHVIALEASDMSALDIW